MLLTLFITFLQILGSGDINLLEKSKTQAEYYINNIEEKQYMEESLWALTVVGSEHPDIKKFIESKIATGNYSSRLLNNFKNFEEDYESQIEKIVFQTGSPDLFIELLLNSNSKEKLYQRYASQFDLPHNEMIKYNSLCRAIIEDREISSNILSNQIFTLPHFFLLYDSNGYKLFPEKYFQNVSENWQSNLSSQYNIRTILYQTSYFRALYKLSRYSETTEVYESLINDSLFPNSYLKLRIFSRYLDYSMFRLGYFDRNLEIARNSTLPLARYLNQKALEVRIQYTTGINLYSIGKLREAEQIYKTVLEQTKKNDYGIKRSSLYANLAITYLKQGKYDMYLDLQFRALEYAEENDDYPVQLGIIRNLFVYYRESQNFENALNYLEQAKNLAESKGDSTDLGEIYIYLGSVYRTFQHDYVKAHELFSRAEKILDANNDSRDFISLLNEKALTFEEQHRYKTALKIYNQILEISPKKSSPYYLDALVNKAMNNLKLGNIFKVGQLVEEFKAHNLSQLDFDQIIKAKTVEAEYLNKKGNTQKSLNILKPALSQAVKRAQSSADLETGFWHVEEEVLDAFDLAVNILIENNRPKEAIQLLDQLKTINDASLYQSPLVKASLLNESQLTQYKNLTNQLDASRKKLLTAPESQRFEIQQTINQLKLKKRTLDKKLTTQIEPDPISIREIQSRISGRELVMHITELNEQYYIANITRSEVSMKVLPFDSTKKKLFSDAVKQVSTHKTDLDSLYAITNFLGLKDIPEHIEKITIIPDSYLYQLPIDILPLEEPTHSYSYGEVRYLIEKFNTRYLTSLNDFRPNANEPTSSSYEQDFAGYGISNFGEYGQKKLVPLPYAQTEVRTIAEKLTQLPNKKTYINNASTKNRFTQTAPRSSILHLATHSEVSERDPLFSTIYMSKTSNNTDSTFQDQIFAYELFELNLNNEMIMLNSCESGSGSYIQGTGVMGISRALHYAGAKSLILNLWSVNDMLASDFAIYFYEQLNKGKSKSEALRSTKRHFLRTKNASPHFWGPYMLIGDTKPVVHPNRKMNLAVAGTFIFYFLLMIGLSYLKGRKKDIQSVQHSEIA